MEIILGKTAGFCYGVKRAVDGAKEEIEKGKEIYCLGEIVHNKNVVNDLKEKGLKFIDNIEDAKGKTIIRAHGISRQVYSKAKDQNIEIKDLTCPSVLKIHEIVKEYSEKGYFIILTGKEKHPEVVGIQSYCGENYIIINEIEELEKHLEKIKEEENILLISQTTYNSKKFDEIEETIKKVVKKNTNLIIKKTICSSTQIRQKETEEIAKNVDIMIIIGDRKSSNTNKLYDISSKFCNKVLFIGQASELDLNDFKNVNKVGIMAGASTPKEDIIEVEKILKNY